MAVVGADDELVFTGLFDDVVEVFGDLSGDPHVVAFQGLLIKAPSASFKASLQLTQHIGDPT